MQPKPKPTEWPMLRTNEVENYRFLLCPNYKDCLTWAAAEHWQGFTCIFCLVWFEAKKGD